MEARPTCKVPLKFVNDPPCLPRKLILDHAKNRQITTPGFEPQSSHCPSKYCNYSATEADQIPYSLFFFITSYFIMMHLALKYCGMMWSLHVVSSASLCGVSLQMERQMMMQNVMREQQMAIQLARGRDLFHWWMAFYVTAAVGAIAG